MSRFPLKKLKSFLKQKGGHKPPTIPPTTSQSSKSTPNFPTNSYLSNYKLKYHSKQPNKPQTPSCQNTKLLPKKKNHQTTTNGKNLQTTTQNLSTKKITYAHTNKLKRKKKKTKLFFHINSPPPTPFLTPSSLTVHFQYSFPTIQK